MKVFWGSRAASLCALAVGVWLSAAVGQATAATFVVTATADTNDGACTVALCSLRDAVIAANASPGADIITLPAGTYTLTIPGTGENAAATGDLDISDDVTINGASAATTIVDGGALDRVFDINLGTVIFNNLTIRNGLPGSAESGGGIRNSSILTLNGCIVSGNHTGPGGDGGGILNSNTMTISNSTISGNSGAVSGTGGGIHNSSTMTITNSVISGNSETAGGDGSGIYNSSTLTITGSTISGNFAGPGGGNGGGIYNSSTLTLTSSTVSGNSAGPSGGNGGGIYNSSAVTITNSTVSANVAAGGGNGAGIYDNGVSLTMSGSTVSGNTTGTGDGGGIYENGTILSITNSTISANSAAAGGGLFNNGIGVTLLNATIASNTGGGIDNNGVNVGFTSTIIANNGVNCTGASFSDGGTNLQFPGTTCGVSITSADPLLQALANNGGPTQTQALTVGSPAIDAGTEVCPPTPPTDQRGVARPQGPACDIGAFELQAGAPLPTLSIDNVTANEGNSGTTPFVFTVTLSASSASTVTVNYATADGTATAGSDYIATSGILTFNPGVTTQPVTVNVTGDTTVEPNETFFVNLSSPSNATIATGQGTGTIVNDDGVIPPPNVPIPTMSAWGLVGLSMLLVLLGLWGVRTRRR